MPFTALPVPKRPPASVPVVGADGLMTKAWVTYFDQLSEYLRQFAAAV
jgi:hypothetical protein